MSESLIIGDRSDLHVQAVRKALQIKGHDATLLEPRCFPSEQFATFRFSDEETSWDIDDREAIRSSRLNPSTVWVRRLQRPLVPAEAVHPDDLRVAQNECDYFYRNLAGLLYPSAFTINPVRNQATYDCKPTQLRLARQCGLRIPATVMSNRPDEIRSLLAGGKPILFKTFTPNHWVGERESRYTFASTISLEDLPSDEILRLTPGIYQEAIACESELRVTVMGRHVFASEIRYSGIDYRREVLDLPVHHTTIPQDLENRLLRFMAGMGIYFGCFDLLRTEAGEYYFLEINPSGQWLWLEHSNPELMLLDAFTEMMAHGGPDFDWKPSSRSVRFADVLPHLREDSPERRRNDGGWTVRESVSHEEKRVQEKRKPE